MIKVPWTAAEDVREARKVMEISAKKLLRLSRELMRKEIVTQFITTRRSNYRIIQKNSD